MMSLLHTENPPQTRGEMIQATVGSAGPLPSAADQPQSAVGLTKSAVGFKAVCELRDAQKNCPRG